MYEKINIFKNEVEKKKNKDEKKQVKFKNNIATIFRNIEKFNNKEIKQNEINNKKQILNNNILEKDIREINIQLQIKGEMKENNKKKSKIISITTKKRKMEATLK